MPNFDAKIRTDYADIEGLVLDCRESGLALDGSLWTNVAPPARAVRTGAHTGANNQAALEDGAAFWGTDELVGCTIYNVTDGSAGAITANTDVKVTATLAGGTDNDWDTDDEYVITTPRFGNPYQDTAAARPTVSAATGIKRATFERTLQQFFKIPLDYGILAGEWFVAFDWIADVYTSTQTVLGFPNLEIMRINAGGTYEYRHNGVSVGGPTDLLDGFWTLYWTSAVAAAMDLDAAGDVAGTASDAAIDAGDPAGYIGSSDGLTDWLDGTLASMQMWTRRPSPLELDFAYQTLDPDGTDRATYTRADMLRRDWTDDTADASAGEVSRVNPSRFAAQTFQVAQFSAGGAARIQIAATVNGLVLPDSLLGGELFDMVCIEYPSAGPPAVYPDPGWSAVRDVVITASGHYTFAVYRENGGTRILHLDAEGV